MILKLLTRYMNDCYFEGGERIGREKIRCSVPYEDGTHVLIGVSSLN
jgi:hypothetical protein